MLNKKIKFVKMNIWFSLLICSTTGFIIGYGNYQSIQLVKADCNSEIPIDLEIVSVETDFPLEEHAIQEEKIKWADKAFISSWYLSTDDFLVMISKEESNK